MIPADINIESLHGPKKGLPPVHFRGEDQIYWNEAETHFVIIYTIFEVTMCNEIGHIAWGVKTDNGHKIIENPKGIIVTCWNKPFCRWLDGSTFVFKSHKYDSETNNIYLPLVEINLDKGFHVLVGTNNTDSKITDCLSATGSYEFYTETKLLDSIKKQP